MNNLPSIWIPCNGDNVKQITQLLRIIGYQPDDIGGYVFYANRHAYVFTNNDGQYFFGDKSLEFYNKPITAEDLSAMAAKATKPMRIQVKDKEAGEALQVLFDAQVVAIHRDGEIRVLAHDASKARKVLKDALILFVEL